MKAEETETAEAPTFERSDVEATLEENGYSRGAAHPDPEKDATHVWHSPDNTKFVMFREPEDGTVVYGDTREAGIALSYDRMILVVAGIVSLEEAKRPAFKLPGGVAKKFGALAASTGSSEALAVPEAAAETPKALLPKAEREDDGVLSRKRSGRGGVF